MKPPGAENEAAEESAAKEEEEPVTGTGTGTGTGTAAGSETPRTDGDANASSEDEEDEEEDAGSQQSEEDANESDEYSDSGRPKRKQRQLVLRARVRNARKSGSVLNSKLRAKKRFTNLPPRPIQMPTAPPPAPAPEPAVERAYISLGPEATVTTAVDPATLRKRERDRNRMKKKSLIRQVERTYPPPPPIPPSKVPKDIQLNTNFVTLIGSAILAHPLRHAPVAFITEWLKAACPEKWGDHVVDRKPNWKSAISSVLSQYDCFEKKEVYQVDNQEKPANYWWVRLISACSLPNPADLHLSHRTIKDEHLRCFNRMDVKEPYVVWNYSLKDQNGPLRPKAIPIPEPLRLTPRGTYLTEDNEEKELFPVSDAAKAILHSVAGNSYHLTLNMLDEPSSPEPEPVNEFGSPASPFVPEGSALALVPIGAPAGTVGVPVAPGGPPNLGRPQMMGPPPPGSMPPPYPPMYWDPSRGPPPPPPPPGGFHPGMPPPPPGMMPPIPPITIRSKRQPRGKLKPPEIRPYPPPFKTSREQVKSAAEWAKIAKDGGFAGDEEPPNGSWTVPIDEYTVDINEILKGRGNVVDTV